MTKLIAFDLDNTLLNTKKEVTPETLRVLKLAAELGIEIVPVTGRAWNAVPDAVKSMEFVRYAVTLNGAEIVDVKNMKTLYGRKGLVKELNLATGTSATTLRTAIRVPAMMSKSTYNKVAAVYGWEAWK